MTTTDVPPSGGSPVSEGWWVQDDQVAATIDMHRLRELTAELGFMPATTDATDIVVPPKSWRVSYAASGLVLDSLIS